MARQKKPTQTNIIDEAISFCLSSASLIISELRDRVVIRSGMPEDIVSKRISRLLHNGFLWMGTDMLIRRLPAEVHQDHKTDLCGVPHNKYLIRDTLGLNQPIRCSCCGATLILTEYSFVAIKTTMAIPRLYRLMCPECP